jgi:hypothetical protein
VRGAGRRRASRRRTRAHAHTRALSRRTPGASARAAVSAQHQQWGAPVANGRYMGTRQYPRMEAVVPTSTCPVPETVPKQNNWVVCGVYTGAALLKNMAGGAGVLARRADAAGAP